MDIKDAIIATNIKIAAILVIYALKISIYFIYSIFNKLDINSKVIMNGYLKILLFSIVGIILYSLLETFVTPYFIQLISI